MKTNVFLLLLTVLVFALNTSAQNNTSHSLLLQDTDTFIHPGMYQNTSDLTYMKQQILAGEEPWKSAFERLKNTTSLDFEPEPFVHVVRGSYGRGSIGGDEFRASARASYRHALMWYITGEKVCTDKVIEIINT